MENLTPLIRLDKMILNNFSYKTILKRTKTKWLQELIYILFALIIKIKFKEFKKAKKKRFEHNFCKLFLL
jgi:hypothetical protein